MTSSRTLPLLLVSNAVASLGAGVAMIAIPWFMVNQPGGAVLFGQLATAVNILLFAITPFIGPFIDTKSRTKLMLVLRICFVLILFLVLCLLGFESTSETDLSLILYYVSGAAFYALNIPLRSAYVRELFKPHQFVRINGILEIENQVAAVITGVTAIFVVERYGLETLTIGNIICFVVAIGCILAIPKSENPIRNTNTHVLAGLREGFEITFGRPQIAVVLVASTIPYVVVIFYTILHPIALKELPEASGSTYALVELLFGLGAIIGGLLISWLTKQNSQLQLLLNLMAACFAIVAISQAFFQTYWGYVVLAVWFGLFNATTRILRQSILMIYFNNDEVGRVGAFLQSWIMLLRASGIAILTVLISGQGVNFAIWFAAFVACLGTLLLFTSKYFPNFSHIHKQRDRIQ